jgi:predicted amidophosphoribosyltransferase
MYCSGCGRALSQGQTICRRFGRPIAIYRAFLCAHRFQEMTAR